MFLSASGLITVEIPIYQLFCGIVVLFGAVEFVGSLFRPKLKVTCAFPERVTAGDVANGIVTVQNQGYLPACDLMCAGFLLPEGIRHQNAHVSVPVLARGEYASIPVELKTTQRGQFAIPYFWVHSTFPLNFMRVGSVPLTFNKLTVVPTYHRLEQLDLPLSHRYQQGGLLSEARTGNAAEYSGNREYIPGEPTKRLDFRAWARVGKPVVREYQEEYSSRVAIVLDTSIQKNWWGVSEDSREELEAAISLTAALTDALDHLGTTVELFAAGPDLFFFEASTQSSTYLESILEILAGLEGCDTDCFEQLTPVIRESLESTSIVICLLLQWDQNRQELVNQIIHSGCSYRVLLLRSRPTALPFPQDDFHLVLSPADVLKGDACLL